MLWHGQAPIRGKDAGLHIYLGNFQKVTINGFLYSFDSTFLLEVVCTQQAEVIVWVDVVQSEDQVYEGLPTAWSMLKPEYLCRDAEQHTVCCCLVITSKTLPKDQQETLTAAVGSNQPRHLPLSFCIAFCPTQQACLQFR